MSAIIISGTETAKHIEERLKKTVEEITPQLGRKPCLAVVLVGENPASKVYVASKTKRALACGMEVVDVELPATINDATLKQELTKLNNNPVVDGILLQLPLPKGLNEFEALLCIKPELDADGLHPLNQGLLLRGAEAPVPCTPKGCMVLIDEGMKQLGRSPKLDGLHAVVVGRSILVGKPMVHLLLDRNCTVSVCHSRTTDLKAEIKRADIVVAAVGRPELVKGDFIKPGAIVIDVGINRLESGKLVGDVEFSSCKEVAGAITPVPGGVGPMTIAMLLENTIESAKRKLH